MSTEKADTRPEATGGPPGKQPRPRTDWIVFGVTAAFTIAFVLWGAFATKSLSDTSTSMLNYVMSKGGWAFVLAASGFVIFALWLTFSRYGKIRLGKDDDKPEFKTVSWIAMMFSAGMGIGLMFYGVTEPIGHFASSPPGTDPTGTGEKTELALATTLFHWTLHPWAIYAVVGLAIAYSSYRRNRRQTISATFTPLIGEKQASGVIGKIIDILAIFATLFGSAASLGLGALQIRSGVTEVGWADSVGVGILLVIIGFLTACFVLSAVSGVERGIQWLSNTNMVLAGLLVLFVFIVGPTVHMLNLIPSSIAAYFENLPQLAGRTAATGGDEVLTWLSDNSVFYWAWWISWTPFVGMFIARISKGRTIRQFIGGVILVPSVVSLVWFAIFGGAAIDLQANDVPIAAQDSQEAQLFTVLNQYPIASVTSLLVMILVGIFFVSGADAASIVMGTLSQRGVMEPSKLVVIFWGVATGAVAAIMLVIGGGGDTALAGLQNLTILVAVPFTIVMAVLCLALTKDLRNDPLILREEQGDEAMHTAVNTGQRLFHGDFELELRPGANGSNTDEAEPTEAKTHAK